MKITHRVPISDPTSAVLSESYANEVRRSTERSERAYAAAEKRLEAAQRRADRARHLAEVAPQGNKRKRAVKAWQDAEALVELRRGEMVTYERMMTAHGAPVPNRGRKSFRPVPENTGSLA